MLIKKLCLTVSLLSINIFAQDNDYIIHGFSFGGKTFPQQPNEVIASQKGSLQEVQSFSAIQAGELLMRRRFGSEEYRMYKGILSYSAFSMKANLFQFNVPSGIDVENLILTKFYSEITNNPDLDEPTVYFGTSRIYAKKYNRLFFFQDGKWKILEGTRFTSIYQTIIDEGRVLAKDILITKITDEEFTNKSKSINKSCDSLNDLFRFSDRYFYSDFDTVIVSALKLLQESGETFLQKEGFEDAETEEYRERHSIETAQKALDLLEKAENLASYTYYKQQEKMMDEVIFIDTIPVKLKDILYKGTSLSNSIIKSNLTENSLSIEELISRAEKSKVSCDSLYKEFSAVSKSFSNEKIISIKNAMTSLKIASELWVSFYKAEDSHQEYEMEKMMRKSAEEAANLFKTAASSLVFPQSGSDESKVASVKNQVNLRGDVLAPSGNIVLISTPSGADILFGGKMIGNSPFIWNNPPQGDLKIMVSKKGYNNVTKKIVFTGGTKTELITLPEIKLPVPSPQTDLGSSEKVSAGTIFISSIPPVADIYIDGKLVGKTNISELPITAGHHSMKYVKGSIEFSETLTFKSGPNPSHFVNLKK